MLNSKTHYLVFTLIFVGVILIIPLFIQSTNEEKVEESHQDKFRNDYRIYSLSIPEKMQFSGEAVPIQVLDVRERMDRELHVNTYWQSNTLLYLKRANKWFPVIEPILKKNGIPDDFKYLALIESGFTHVVSPAGAAGFWQIMKETGKEYGLEISDEIDERYHVEKATEAACNYLNEAYTRFGSWTMAAASYNMGLNGLNKQVKKQLVSNYYDLLLSEETSRYVFRVLAAKELMTNSEKYGFHYREKDLWNNVASYTVDVDTSINNLSEFAQSYNINYKILKHFNPWLRQNTLTVKSGKSYQLKLPKPEFIPVLISKQSE
jgi:membrane-bound lytic murein transglycosylase D